LEARIWQTASAVFPEGQLARTFYAREADPSLPLIASPFQRAFLVSRKPVETGWRRLKTDVL